MTGANQSVRRSTGWEQMRMLVRCRVLTAVLILLVTLASLSIGAQADDRCAESPDPQPHMPPVGYDFETDSSADRGRNGYRTFYTCVRNHDNEDVRIIWYIPQFSFWVLDRGQTNFPRTRKDLLARSITGCLRYGNVGRKIYAEFLGTKAEERLANEQVQRECEGLGAKVTPAPPDDDAEQEAASRASSDLQAISLEYVVHFPSHLKRPRETMLRFAATIDLKPFSKKAYNANLTYSVTRVEGRADGDPASVRIRAKFTGLAESLYPFLNRAYPDGFFPTLGTTLNQDNPITKGAIEFEVSGGTKWELSSAGFEFRDQDEQLVATLTVPVFVPLGLQ